MSMNKSLSHTKNSTSFTPSLCLWSSSITGSFNLPERFCDDPFHHRKYGSGITSNSYDLHMDSLARMLDSFHNVTDNSQLTESVIDLIRLQIESAMEDRNTSNTSDASRQMHAMSFEHLLRTVDHAADEILVIGRERGQARTARMLSNGLLEVKVQDEQKILEYCVQLYTKASFLYRACHRYLSDYYSYSDTKLFNYTQLLDSYIDRYGKSYIGNVYRGALLDDGRLKFYLTTDVHTRWYSLSYLSTSKSRQVAEIFGNVLFISDIQNSSKETEKAVDISGVSSTPDEEEVLLTPEYTLFKTKQFEYDPVLKKHIIYLTSAHPIHVPAEQIANRNFQRSKEKLKSRSRSLLPKLDLRSNNETDWHAEAETNDHSSTSSDE